MLQLLLALPLSVPANDLHHATFTGHVGIEGHYAVPHAVKRYRARLESSHDPAHDAEAIAWTTYYTDADAPRSTTRVVRNGADLWIEQDGRAALLKADDDLAWARTLLSLGARGRDATTERPFTHGRLGDVIDVVRRAFAGDTLVPETLSATLHDAGVVLTFELSRTGEPDEAEAHRLLESPKTVTEDDPRAAGPITVHALGEGLHEALVPSYDSRVLIVDLSDGLAVVQAPGDSWTCEALIDTITAAFPARPIRWVVPTHHHPHSFGGLRAFVAAGATVITTPGVEDLVRARCAAPFTHRTDRLAALPEAARRPTVIAVHGRLTLGDGRARLDVYDLGERSRHTDEHLVVHLPHARLLFHGDLGWHPDGAGGSRMGSRAQGLLELIDAPPLGGPRLDVQAVLQSWPVFDVPATFTPEAIARALE